MKYLKCCLAQILLCLWCNFHCLCYNTLYQCMCSTFTILFQPQLLSNMQWMHLGYIAIIVFFLIWRRRAKLQCSLAAICMSGGPRLLHIAHCILHIAYMDSSSFYLESDAWVGFWKELELWIVALLQSQRGMNQWCGGGESATVNELKTTFRQGAPCLLLKLMQLINWIIDFIKVTACPLWAMVCKRGQDRIKRIFIQTSIPSRERVGTDHRGGAGQLVFRQ